MRIFITRTDTDLQRLGVSVLRRPAAGREALERIMALNPQIDDFQKLTAGTVLILPDGPEFKPHAGTALGGDGFGAIAGDLGSGMEALGSRADDRLAALRADRAGVVAALKSAASRRLVDGDPALKVQLEAAEASFSADQKAAAEAEERLAEVRKFALAEFEKLQKMLAG
jgi:hypothetical protein